MIVQAANKDGKLNSDHCTGIVSVIGALCYLLKKMGELWFLVQHGIWIFFCIYFFKSSMWYGKSFTFTIIRSSCSLVVYFSKRNLSAEATFTSNLCCAKILSFPSFLLFLAELVCCVSIVALVNNFFFNFLSLYFQIYVSKSS